jgi:hypothetical protein
MKRKIEKFLAQKKGIVLGPEDNLPTGDDGRFDFMNDIEGVLQAVRVRAPKGQREPKPKKPKEPKASKKKDVPAEIMGPDGVMVPNPEYTQSKKEGGGRRRKGKSSKKGEAHTALSQDIGSMTLSGFNSPRQMDELLPWSPGLGDNGFTPNIMRANRIAPGQGSSHPSFMSPNDMMDSSTTEDISPTTQSLLMMSPPPLSVMKSNGRNQSGKYGAGASKCSPVPGHTMPPPSSKRAEPSNNAKGGSTRSSSDLQKIVSPTASSHHEKVTGRTLSGDARSLLSPPYSRDRPEMDEDAKNASFQPDDVDFQLNEDSMPDVGVEDFVFEGNFSPDGSLQASPELKRSRMRGISVESSPNFVAGQLAVGGASMEAVSERLSQQESFGR